MSAEPNLDQARSDVARAERELTRHVREATALGEATMHRALAAVRPALVGVIVIGGALILASLVLRARRRAKGHTAPAERSVLGEAVRAATLSLASVAARRVAEHYLGAPEPALSPAAALGAPGSVTPKR